MTSEDGYKEALRRIREVKEKNLNKLDLRNLYLQELPKEVFELKNLKTFSLHSNDNLPFPTDIEKLKNLETFIFANLNYFPKEILYLKNLKNLALFFGKIEKIPNEIYKIENLERLWLQDNDLTSVPKSLLNLKNLKVLNLRNNLKLNIPDEILEDVNSPQKILNYYFSNVATDEKTKPLNEVKMLIVGQGAVGKTSLVNRILNDNFNPMETKTEGILVEKYYSKDIDINIWDFGGQEIYHSTHQFFLTKRSIYLIVISARDGEEQGRLEYWLKMVTSFGGDSPIIIVINKIDEHNIDLNERGLKEKYKNIKGVFKISCKNGANIEELKRAIDSEIERIPHIKDKLVLSWFNIKEKLENMSEDFISYDEYINICKNEKIEDKLSQETLIGFFHDLGIVLNFRDDRRLKDVNVLNPEWITKSIYKIINSHVLFQQKGEVNFNDLEKILNYTHTKIEYIINIMKKFELCFDFEDDKFLIPELLQKEEPYIEFNRDESLRFEYHYSILPLSVISRFIVRVNTLILQKTYWQSGVLLVRNGNKAIVKADLEDKKIFIWIDGKTESRRKLLGIIRSNFEHIHSTISKLEVNEVIPIPNYKNASIDYFDLVDLENQGIEEYYYPKIKDRIKVDELLNGLETKEEREKRKISYNEDLVDRIKTATDKKCKFYIFCFDRMMGIISVLIGIASFIYFM